MSAGNIQPGDELPPNSTVARSAKRRDSIQSPPVQAFRLRKSIGEQELSVGWLEYFADCPTRYEQLAATCTQLTRNYTPGKADRMLCVDVDRARALLGANASLTSVKIVYLPEVERPTESLKANPSHAAVIGSAGLSDALEQLAAEQLALAINRPIVEWSDIRSLGLVWSK
jgi:hypothetical protein